MNQSETPTNPLSSLEISGAISSRVFHDLSNLMSGIMGNAEYLQNTTDADPATLKHAIHAISISADSAGKLLRKCLPLQRLVSAEGFPYDAAEMAARIAEASGLAPGWRVTDAPQLAGQLRVQPRWLASAVWQIAREADAPGGEIDFAFGPVVFPVVWRGPNPNSGRPLSLFQINFRYRSDEMLFSEEGPVDPDRYGLLAAHELIRRFKGQIHARPKPPGRQEISILIPML
jgi:hypothetical protein